MTDLLPAVILLVLTLALGVLGAWISPPATKRSRRSYDDGWWDGFWMGRILEDDDGGDCDD